MCVNERKESCTVAMQTEEVAKVDDLKYLGSTVQSNGECGREVKNRRTSGVVFCCSLGTLSQFHRQFR